MAEFPRCIADIEPLLAPWGTVELDDRRPAGELADVMERLLTG